MGWVIAEYRVAPDDVAVVQADLERAGILSDILSTADAFVELRAFVAVEGAAHRSDLDSLRGTVEDVLVGRGVALHLTRQGFDGGVGEVLIEVPEAE